jgi:intracellular septation protein
VTTVSSRHGMVAQASHLTLELGPGVGFYIAYQIGGLEIATATLMTLTVASMVFGWLVARRIPVLPAVSCLLVIALGGLSLFFADDTFIKVKPTVGKLLFASILSASILLGHPLPRRALDPLLSMTEKGWRVLSWRWVLIAVIFAAGNELAWRTLSSDDWVTVKTVMGPGSILIYYLTTRITARTYWLDEPVSVDPR